MYEQPAIPLLGDEDGIPGLLGIHVEHLVTNETAAHAGSDGLFKPLKHKAMEVVQCHQVKAGAGVAEEHRVGAFPEVVSGLAQCDDGCLDRDFDFIVLRVFCRCCDVLQQESFTRKPC